MPKSYKVSCDADAIDAAFVDSPFNLKRDTKGFQEEEINRIEKDVADELAYGPHGETYVERYYSKISRLITYSKVRVEDKKRDRGKSGGYRCVVLVDNKNQIGYILHIYRHGHGEDNIHRKEEKVIGKIVDEYASAVL